MVIVFTKPRHFVRLHASSFTSPFFSSHSLLAFPRLFRSSSFSTTAHFKFQSFHDHIFIFFLQNMTIPLHYILLALAILSKDSFMPNMSINSSLFLRFNSFTPHMARIIALSVFSKLQSLFFLSTMLQFHTT